VIRHLATLLAAACAALILAAPASAAPTTTACPTFRVLHNSRMTGYRAGVYDMQVWGQVSCEQAVQMFQNYLQRPRLLPRGWRPDPHQSALVHGRTGFSLTLQRRPRTRHSSGSVTNCPGTFRVVHDDPPAGYPRGRYRMQVWGTTTCQEAASVFRAYLANPRSGLPEGWVASRTQPAFVNGRNGFTVFRP